jgi:2-C-methyl-D-erythritol 4-phosphate cytidylyltransferase
MTDTAPSVDNMRHSCALVAAAGTGTRLGLGPKCLLRLGELSVLEIVVAALQALVDEVWVAVPAELERPITALLAGRAQVLVGGRTRHESIARLLQASAGQLVLVHDGARPFASRALYSAVLDAATRYGAAGAFLDPAVPVGHLENDVIASYQTGDEARIFQTPQAYARDVLLTAGQKTGGRQFQSTAQMVIAGGYPLHAIPGEPENIKITTSLDWLIAQNAIAPKLGLLPWNVPRQPSEQEQTNEPNSN